MTDWIFHKFMPNTLAVSYSNTKQLAGTHVLDIDQHPPRRYSPGKKDKSLLIQCKTLHI